MLKPKLLAVATLIVAIGAGCVGGSKGLSAEDKEKLAAYVVEGEPAEIQHKVDINFENKIHLIGYKADPEVAKPGTEVKITWYWRCDDSLDEGWSLFTHIHDDVADKSDNIDWVGPLRENRDNKMLLGPSRWEKGKTYLDQQTYKVPEWVKGSELTFMLGIWKGNARLRVITGANDGDNRAIGAKLKTGVTAPPPAEIHTDLAPSVTVIKLAAGEKIIIDGKSDDRAWGGAPILGPFVDVGTGSPNTSFPVNATAKVAYDDANLYVLAEVQSAGVVGGWNAAGKKQDEWTVAGQPKCWTKDAVELMIEPDDNGNNKDYYELQISPENKVFHSQYDEYNLPKTEPNGPFGHEDWDPKLKSAVVVHGKLASSYDAIGNPDGGATGYTVEVAIPFAAFNKPGQHAPKSGESWRINAYAMRQNGGVAWSPVLGKGNFHKAERFGRLTFSLPGDTGPVITSPAMGAAFGRFSDSGVVGMLGGRPRFRLPGAIAPPKPPVE